MKKRMVTVDGNEAASNMAYAFSEVAAIYPITPSSPMGELADSWAAKGKENLFGEQLDIIEMQSEAGAAGAVHGALSAGALTTTYTASQGLLLMIPNMYKIAGEMMPTVFHVSARSIAAQALSIFGDHSDVMSVRMTGFGLLSSNSVQEAQDMAAVAHLASLETRIPFVHFFDGFRTSHEMQKIEALDYDTLRTMVNMEFVERFRDGAMRPEKPICKVGAQNPDVYFQGRETVNQYYDAAPAVVRKYMKLLSEKTGRNYDLYQYIGAPDAEKIVIAMGSACETIEETIDYLVGKGEKIGALKVRLYRPFSIKDFTDAIPKSVKKIAVLDRTKEPGATGEPLYLDTIDALKDRNIHIIGGRYGLSSKEFTPAMVKAVYDHLDNDGHHGFTVGINDDVTNLSIPVGEPLDTEQEGVTRCKFWGYGSDGTVSANKNSIKILGSDTDLYVQAYFDYDSNKSGGYTVSHLRFGKKPIKSQYKLTACDFIALHRQQYIGRYDILEGIVEGGTFLINSGLESEKLFAKFTKDMQDTIIQKKIKVYAIDASKIAKKVGLGNRINTVMQTAFFKLANMIPADQAIELIKKHVEKQFASKGQEIVQMNWDAIDAAVDALVEIEIPETIDSHVEMSSVVPDGSNDFAMKIVDPVLRLKGDDIPVSLMPLNGAVPTNTKRLEKDGKPGKVPVKWMAKYDGIRDAQFEETYFEYPGCCQGCGEVIYIHMITQLYGDRMLIANATGCSSIYGGTFPTTPFSVDSKGRGPTWANSLFEDNAEYGFGMRLAVDANRKQLKTNVKKALELGVAGDIAAAFKKNIEHWDDVAADAKTAYENTLALLPAAVDAASGDLKPVMAKINELRDYFVDKSVWCFGGDGWAYDIGYGGLDHIMASNKNINVLVMDTEVYSNTGGQASKATPRGAIAKFAASGKQSGKKNLGLMLTTYGSCYVAQVNYGMDREQTLKAIQEAEAFDGPSIIIAYSPCIAHGYDMKLTTKQSKKAGETGYWPIYRYNPAVEAEGKNPFVWESVDKTADFKEFTSQEIRYRALELAKPAEAERLHKLAVKDNERRYEDLRKLEDKE